jgi:peptidoglycan/xylan/chitin deacetylase (PgdA/CDA1 family)
MIRAIAFTFLLVCSLTTHAASSCVVLQYHHIADNTPAITSVTLSQFQAHLDYLKAQQFHVMPLRTVVTALQNGDSLPDKCVSLTVDDAYLSIYSNAFPLLKKLGWPMTVFVNTEGVDKGVDSYMNWDQMREMAEHDFIFENHGHGHIHMIRKTRDESRQAWRDRIVNDIQTAQSRITQELGDAPRLFAHPYGEYNPEITAIITAMGLTGFGQQSGPVWSGANFGALPRFPMNVRYANIQSFITRVNTLPLPVVNAEPEDPLVSLGEWRPALKLTLVPDSYSKDNLQCFVAGSNNVEITWSEERADLVTITPKFDLKPGRSRTNCTMPYGQVGRYHWYSHNWFVRKADGSWYAEY